MRLGIKSFSVRFIWPLLLIQCSQGFVIVSPRMISGVQLLKSQTFYSSKVWPLTMVKSVSPLHKTVKLGGPLATLGLTLPQVGDLSVKNIQRVGETAFGAMLLVAAVQGALIMHQYSTNPAGELIVPPGLTFGTEDATQIEANIDPERRSAGENRQKVQETLQSLDDLIWTKNDDSIQANVKKGWYSISRLLFIFIPLAIEQFGCLAMQYSHLMHFAVIMGLVHIYDFFQQLPDTKEGVAISDEPEFGEEPHILVIGDSMGVGVGCVNKFDPEKNSGILQKIEQIETDTKQAKGFGPVFPRILARTLSKRLNRPVSWRSAGVDGGDVDQIHRLLLPVVQEEVEKGRPPDIVVVLTGSNDLKRIIQGSNAGTRASVRGFRGNLIRLAKEIHRLSPTTRVILPALPTYRLDTNSILNIFPLSLFLDGMIGFWDAQKKIVANTCCGVLHVDLKFNDVYKWYVEETGSEDEDPTLIAADGIHPNGKCYGKWGEFVGNSIVDRVEEAQKRGPSTQPRRAFGPEELGLQGPQ